VIARGWPSPFELLHRLKAAARVLRDVVGLPVVAVKEVWLVTLPRLASSVAATRVGEPTAPPVQAARAIFVWPPPTHPLPFLPLRHF
jgi:hypothetical protein